MKPVKKLLFLKLFLQVFLVGALPKLRSCSSEQTHIDDYNSNMCNKNVISHLIGPIASIFSLQDTDDFYLPKVAGNNEIHFCNENLDFTCCDSKMLYKAFHKDTFRNGLRRFQGLKGKIIKVYRIFQLLKSVDYQAKLDQLVTNEEKETAPGTMTSFRALDPALGKLRRDHQPTKMLRRGKCGFV